MKILWVSDFDIIGSGFLNVSVPLCDGLASLGHDVKAVGLGYKGQEHDYNFSIIPAATFQEADVIIQNLDSLWKFDFLIVAMDIYIQDAIMRHFPKRTFQYIGIFPVEADPLCITWAGMLVNMSKALVISEFGAKEVQSFGIAAEHIQVGINTTSWKVPTSEERLSIRKAMFGVENDMLVVLTVADNQERKNLSAAMEIFASYVYGISPDEMRKRTENLTVGELTVKNPALYVLVTREHSMVGWRLRDLAQEYGISDKFMLYERGMAYKQLWMLYAGADVFLLTSKAEGLGLPLLEAMSVKLPCIATDCTGMKELLSDNRGWLIPYEYVHRDPFGNGRRYWINRQLATEALQKIATGARPDVDSAHTFAESRTWEKSVLHLDEVIKKLKQEGEK